MSNKYGVKYSAVVTKINGEKETVHGVYNEDPDDIQDSSRNYLLKCWILYHHFKQGEAIGTDNVDVLYAKDVDEGEWLQEGPCVYMLKHFSGYDNGLPRLENDAYIRVHFNASNKHYSPEERDKKERDLAYLIYSHLDGKTTDDLHKQIDVLKDQIKGLLELTIQANLISDEQAKSVFQRCDINTGEQY